MLTEFLRIQKFPGSEEDDFQEFLIAEFYTGTDADLRIPDTSLSIQRVSKDDFKDHPVRTFCEFRATVDSAPMKDTHSFFVGKYSYSHQDPCSLFSFRNRTHVEFKINEKELVDIAKSAYSDGPHYSKDEDLLRDYVDFQLLIGNPEWEELIKLPDKKKWGKGISSYRKRAIKDFREFNNFGNPSKSNIPRAAGDCPDILFKILVYGYLDQEKQQMLALQHLSHNFQTYNANLQQKILQVLPKCSFKNPTVDREVERLVEQHSSCSI